MGIFADVIQFRRSTTSRQLELNKRTPAKETSVCGRAALSGPRNGTLCVRALAPVVALGAYKRLVPSKGLEPPHPCEYMDLNHARLPIPPRWQVDLHCSGSPKAADQEDLHLYSTEAQLPVKPISGLSSFKAEDATS